MHARPLARHRLRTSEKLARRRAALVRTRARLSDGAQTTLHVASYDRAQVRTRIVALPAPRQLAAWCRDEDVRHAVVGGFFRRPDGTPLGEVRIAGRPVASVPVHAPWGAVRACVAIADGDLRIARRHELAPTPAGDLLQAGPLLVRDGQVAIDGADPEGFSAGADQFDSDITRGRYPRAALALTPTRVLAVACDGRTAQDAGMTLTELARALIELGAVDALNLDGGGSTSLVHNGRLRNHPREEHGVDLLGGRAIATAIVLELAPPDRRLGLLGGGS